MAKSFSLNSISGVGRAKAGEGLLSEASVGMKTNKKTTTYVPISSIHLYKDNNMSLDEIEELAATILANGCILEEPVVLVQRADGEYDMISGHRRYYAVMLLIERGKWQGPEEIEAKIRDLDDIDLDLDDDLKKKWLVRVANMQRVKTDADKAVELADFREIISKLREKGVDTLNLSGLVKDDSNDAEEGSSDEVDDTPENQLNNEEIGIQIKGRKTIDVLHDVTGLSTGNIRNYTRVQDKGTKQLQDALKSNRISGNLAGKIALFDKDTQDEILNEIHKAKEDDSPITQDELNAAKKIVKKRHNKDDSNHTITEAVLTEDLSQVMEAVREENAILTEDEYKKYKQLMKKLAALLS